MIPAGYPGSSKPAVLVPKAGKGRPSSTSVFATQVTETRHTGCYRTKLVITPIGALRESIPGTATIMMQGYADPLQVKTLEAPGFNQKTRKTFRSAGFRFAGVGGGAWAKSLTTELELE